MSHSTRMERSFSKLKCVYAIIMWTLRIQTESGRRCSPSLAGTAAAFGGFTWTERDGYDYEVFSSGVWQQSCNAASPKLGSAVIAASLRINIGELARAHRESVSLCEQNLVLSLSGTLASGIAACKLMERTTSAPKLQRSTKPLPCDNTIVYPRRPTRKCNQRLVTTTIGCAEGQFSECRY